VVNRNLIVALIDWNDENGKMTEARWKKKKGTKLRWWTGN